MFLLSNNKKPKLEKSLTSGLKMLMKLKIIMKYTIQNPETGTGNATLLIRAICDIVCSRENYLL